MNVSLVIPVYNEQANIQKGVLDKIGNYTAQNNDFIEVIIVDDGSTDNSMSTIKQKYLPQFKKFRLIENPHQGKAYTVMTGIRSAKATYVLFSDIDLATPIEESEKLLEQAKKGYQIIIGSRSSRRAGAPLLRKIMAVGFIYIRDTFIGLRGIKDTQCGFKLFETKAAVAILDKLQVFKTQKEISGSSVSAGFDLEFLFIARRNGYKIIEVPVSWRHVETKNVSFVKDSLEALHDVFLIRWNDVFKKYV